MSSLARRVLVAALAIEALLLALHIPARIADGARIFRMDEMLTGTFVLVAAVAAVAGGGKAWLRPYRAPE